MLMLQSSVRLEDVARWKERQLCQQRSRMENVVQSVSEVRDWVLTDARSQVL